ncbi:MAG: (deoxy)nucleoside triphosphate pyrophosphohydrolase [Pelovirga sp.]
MNLSQPQQPTIVCAAIIIHQQKVLLTLRPEDKRLGGYWEFPGGKLEAGESPHAALHRELREELDIEVKIEHLLEKVHHRYTWGHVRIDGYLCSYTGGTIRHLEVADHAWVPFDRLDTYNILPADQPFIEWLKKQYQP